MRLNKHRHRGNTSDRIYQPDSQDGRKRAKGDDSNFEMKILIQPLASTHSAASAPGHWQTGKAWRPLEETAGLIRRSHHFNG